MAQLYLPEESIESKREGYDDDAAHLCRTGRFQRNFGVVREFFGDKIFL